MDHTPYLYITLTRNKSIPNLDAITLRQHFLPFTPSGKKKKRKEKEGKTLQRDKVGSQCSNINMTSPIPSLQYTLLTSVQKSFLTIWSYSRQEAKTL